MTAPQPYSVIEEKDRREDSVLEEEHSEFLHEQIDSAVLELHILTGSLGTVGELMLNADREIHSVEVGTIIDHYIGLISDGLGRIEEVLTLDMREGTE